MMQMQSLLTWQEIKNSLKAWKTQENTTKIVVQEVVKLCKERSDQYASLKANQQPFGNASEGFFQCGMLNA